MMGYQELSASVWIIGLLLFIFCLMIELPPIAILLIFAGIIFTFFSMMIPNYIISANQLQPLINKIKPKRNNT